MSYILERPLAAYPYVQYQDDDDISAFFIAYNKMAQDYVDFFNQYNLADYNSTLIVDDLLDWTAEGIYGTRRPYLVDGSAPAALGPLGTVPLGSSYLGFFGWSTGSPPAYSFVTDEIYKRCLTWNLFKGDGVQFNIKWLKRRVARFITDNLYPEETYDIGVTFTGTNGVTITIPDTPNAQTFRSLIRSGALELPFQYAFTVNVI